jgi:hypothetical protein
MSYDEPDTEDADASSDEERFQEVASQYATQQRSKQRVENLPANNGIIETVTCTNFMCHSFLEIGLGPLINFIIGHNGSGKSAVLTAITICLGGKATATNRGQSLKSFIKEGEELVENYTLVWAMLKGVGPQCSVSRSRTLETVHIRTMCTATQS